VGFKNVLEENLGSKSKRWERTGRSSQSCGGKLVLTGVLYWYLFEPSTTIGIRIWGSRANVNAF
jgi:hypothetical protein